MTPIETRTVHYQNGDYYEGGMRDELAEGEGTITYACGCYYVGQFSGGFFTGFGAFHQHGYVYKGDFDKNERHGFGVQYYPSGARHEGHFENGVKQGFGVSCLADGDRIEGEWLNNKLQGNATYIHENGQ